MADKIELDREKDFVEEIIQSYEKRLEITLDAFENAGWKLLRPNASMFIWAKLPVQKAHLKSLEFSKQLLQKAQVAVSPGVGFGEAGDEYVRIALIENENRIRQAARNIKKFLKE